MVFAYVYICTAGADGSGKHHIHHHKHANMNGKKRVIFHATSSLIDVSECEQSWADDDYSNINNNSNMLQRQQSYHDPTGMHHDEINDYKQVSFHTKREEF
jgi:hypothetical protein